ncbi:MAG: lysozyme inhibitor LprI family protein [Ginsengibacter sp.]
MRKGILLVALFLFQTTAYCQSSDSIITITPSIAKKIDEQVKNKVDSFKATLSTDEEWQTQNEFATDTFRIERFLELYMDYDWSTAGMVTATMDAAAKYDSLLNKCYKKLLAILQPKDKKVLVKAERAWIAYKDSEMKLLATVTDEKYSGGGTIQQMLDVSRYYDIIKDRAVALFGYYQRDIETK